ncbi:hypothetical protein [Spirosoma sp. KNUC1025]|uniref:hypothetical protein n=1 Tax=Spirosoma sp. KNUC1025 TaxID=2894082 RepID=UPI0038651C23|nr:hypothetical protein LN737_09120 [Spirosoma sp. KNUC1025]
MNQDKSITLSGYDASAEEVQSLVMKWVKATEAFHLRYAKLDKTINTLQKSARRPSSPNRTRLHRLIELRQHSTDVLMTLFLDMSGPRPDRSAQSSKPGQLYSHACLLDELNRKIDAELVSVTTTTVAQA